MKIVLTPLSNSLEISLISNRLKSLFSDTIAFTLSGMSVKVLSFFMVPLYTYFLSTEDYAITDLVNLSIQLAIPILTLSISDAVLRFGLDAKTENNAALGEGLRVTIAGTLLSIPICLSIVFFVHDAWLGLFSFLLFTFQNFSNYFSSYFKCANKTKIMAIISSVTGMTIVCFNVAFIAGLHLGLIGYWLGNVIGNLLGVSLYVLNGGWKAFSLITNKNESTLRQMLKYSIPLMPNSLFWWINSSMDRFILSAMTTLSFVGLYSAASKIPQILTTFAGFFFQAWNISVFKNFGSAESSQYFRRGFVVLSNLLFLGGSLLIILTVPFAQLLFSGDFFEAWRLVPLLITGTAVSLLNQFLGSVFTASKETKMIFTTTAIGSMVNIVLNFVLIIGIGGIGAVIATLVSYIVVYFARAVRISKSYSFIKINWYIPLFQIFLLIAISLMVMSELSLMVEIFTVCLGFLPFLVDRFLKKSN